MTSPLLCIRGLTRSFGSLVAVDALDMDVGAHAICGLIGPNGSGKTTAFNLVSGVLRPDAGSVRFGEADITATSADKIAAMGLMRTYQHARLMPQMSCLENVMLGMHPRTSFDVVGTYLRIPGCRSRQEEICRRRAHELLGFVSLADLADKPAKSLVWVEAQLLQIARAIAGNPKLLLLDEPTAGMGPAETKRVEGIIREVRDTGVTVVLIAHDVGLVMGLCDWVVAVNFGRKICEGPPSVVQCDERVAEAYLGSEVGGANNA